MLPMGYVIVTPLRWNVSFSEIVSFHAKLRQECEMIEPNQRKAYFWPHSCYDRFFSWIFIVSSRHGEFSE